MHTRAVSGQNHDLGVIHSASRKMARVDPPQDGLRAAHYKSLVVFRPKVPMARNTSVSLGDHFAGFIDQKVKEGRHGSVRCMIRAGLRLLEEEETKLTRLRALIAKGEASGPANEID
jgi:antitoxin ParD1/3/4